MTCEACCREFVAKRHRKVCPWCQYNNGRGWQPRVDDMTGRVRREELNRSVRAKRRIYADMV